MKLHHLLAEETVKQYTNRLVRSLNIKRLGRGHYSQVFQHPVYHNVAVKLCTLQDPASIIYLREAQKRPHNPWFPKVESIHRVAFHDTDLSRDEFNRKDADGDLMMYVTHIAFLEKLKPVKGRQYNDACQLLLASVPDRFFAMQVPMWKVGMSHAEVEARQDIIAYNEHQPFNDPREEVTLEGITDEQWAVIARNATDPHVKELARVLLRLNANDIHDGNVMLNADGHPVITDPVAS